MGGKNQQEQTRRLATILAADILGYSRLMDADEEGTYAALHSARSGIIEPKIKKHKARIVKHTGDGFLAEFPTVLSAVKFAMQLQEEMGRRAKDVPDELKVKFRIGINLGDIIVDDTGDIFGDGVNVAARLDAYRRPELDVRASRHQPRSPRSACVVRVGDVDVRVRISESAASILVAAVGDPTILVGHIDPTSIRAAVSDGDPREVVSYLTVVAGRREQGARADLGHQRAHQVRA